MFNSKKQKKQNKNDTSISRILSDKAEFAVSESYKSARTNIIFSLHDIEDGKVIMCTSAVPGEGKTTTTINLSISFAQTGAKVIIIDADLRKPKVGTYLELKNKKGLSDILGGFEDNYENAIQRAEGKSIDCITAGKIPPNPSELLGSKEMDGLLEYLKSRYDYIFVDVPPINVVTDGMVLSKKCTGTIIIVKESSTTHDMFKSAVDTIKFSGARIIGFIVNSSVVRKGSRYGHYKYKYKKSPYGVYGVYGYGYGYNYKYEEDSKQKEENK